MNCPYCDAGLSPSVLSCKACGRDISVVRPLLERIDRLEQAVDELKQSRTSSAEVPSAALVTVPDDRNGVRPATIASRSLPVALGFLFLLAAHAIVVIWLDLPLVWLRVTSIIIPWGAGFMYARGNGWFRLSDLAIAGVFACASVFAMSVVVAFTDNVAILPSDISGWCETLVYAVSIFAAFATGALCRRITLQLRVTRLLSPKGVQAALSATADRVEPQAVKGLELVTMIVSMIVSASVAIFTALSGLFK